MKKISIYFLPLFMLAACAAEEAVELESPKDSDSPKIVVFGGSTAPGVTRADNFPEPYNYGVCNANKIKILTFKGTTTSGRSISAGNLSFMKEDGIDLSNNLNYRDKWTSHSMSLSLDASSDNWFAFPSIAYNSNDEDKFTVNNASYKDLILNIQSKATTPELFFGRLLPVGNDYKSTNTTGDSHESEDMRYKYRYAIDPEMDNQQFTGKLYRIVSQLNIHLTDIIPSVDKIEIYLSNLPTQIGLYAKHRTTSTNSGTDRGYFYPVVEATGDSQHRMEETLVCSVTDFPDGTAKFSTFILPSNLGRTVTIKAYFKAGDKEDEDKTVEEARILRASKNYNLDAETSLVYFSKTELPVYNAATNEFKSYPNVRVNVSGSFSDIFSEESDSNVEIEICPYYDGEHEITI